MIAFLGAALLAALLGLRGGDRALLAALEKSGVAWKPPTAVAVLTGGLTAGVAAWAGAELAGAAGASANWIGAGGLLLAAVRFLVPRNPVILREPTRSMFAFALVLAMVQACDAVRLMVFAVAALTREPLLAACGGFLGASAGLAQSAPRARR